MVGMYTEDELQGFDKGVLTSKDIIQRLVTVADHIGPACGSDNTEDLSWSFAMGF